MDDMKELSLRHPEVVFTLDGQGEESGDVWRMYFKNGKFHKSEVTITYEAFDESKLELK